MSGKSSCNAKQLTYPGRRIIFITYSNLNPTRLSESTFFWVWILHCSSGCLKLHSLDWVLTLGSHSVFLPQPPAWWYTRGTAMPGYFLCITVLQQLSVFWWIIFTVSKATPGGHRGMRLVSHLSREEETSKYIRTVPGTSLHLLRDVAS